MRKKLFLFLLTSAWVTSCGKPYAPQSMELPSNDDLPLQWGSAECNQFNVFSASDTVVTGQVQHPIQNGQIDQDQLQVKITHLSNQWLSQDSNTLKFKAGEGRSGQFGSQSMPIASQNTILGFELSPLILRNHQLQVPFTITLSGAGLDPGTQILWNLVRVTASTSNSASEGDFLIPFFLADPRAYAQQPDASGQGYAHNSYMLNIHPFADQLNSTNPDINFVQESQKFCF